MTSYRAWQEAHSDSDKYEEHRVISIFPIDRGFLITLRDHYSDREKPSETFGHAEVTFFASFEQANEIAHTLLTHIRSKFHHPDPSSPDITLPGS
jgi:hypothetical protein